MPDKSNIFNPSFFRTMQLETLVRDLSTTALAIAIGGISYRRMSKFNRILLLQAFIYVVVDTIGFMINVNLWLYNIYVPVEIALVFLALSAELKMESNNRLLKGFFGVFLLIFVIEMYVIKMQKDFIYVSALTGYLFATVSYTYALYHKFNSATNLKHELPFIFTAFGLVIYFAGSIPCLAAMSSLMSVDMGLSQSLFQHIVLLLGILRYLFLAASFGIASRFTVITRNDVR